MVNKIKRRFAIGTDKVERINSSGPKIDSRADMNDEGLEGEGWRK